MQSLQEDEESSVSYLVPTCFQVMNNLFCWFENFVLEQCIEVLDLINLVLEQAGAPQIIAKPTPSGMCLAFSLMVGDLLSCLFAFCNPIYYCLGLFNVGKIKHLVSVSL